MTGVGARIAWGGVTVVIFLLFIGPLVVLILNAASARWPYPELLPAVWSARGIDFLLRNGRGIVASIFSSFAYSLVTVVLALFLCVFPARVLAWYEFRGRVLLEALLLSPVLVPAITYGMGIHFLFIRLGIANRAIGVVLVLTAASYPYMLRALIAGFEQVDPDYDTCAANLGAGPLRRLFVVTVPLIVPAILAGGTIVFLVAFSDYFLVFLIGGGAVRSFTGYLFPFLTAGDRTIGSILTILFVLVPLVLFVVLEVIVRNVYRSDSKRYNVENGAQGASSRFGRPHCSGSPGPAP